MHRNRKQTYAKKGTKPKKEGRGPFKLPTTIILFRFVCITCSLLFFLLLRRRRRLLFALVVCIDTMKNLPASLDIAFHPSHQFDSQISVFFSYFFLLTGNYLSKAALHSQSILNLITRRKDETIYKCVITRNGRIAVSDGESLNQHFCSQLHLPSSPFFFLIKCFSYRASCICSTYCKLHIPAVKCQSREEDENIGLHQKNTRKDSWGQLF